MRFDGYPIPLRVTWGWLGDTDMQRKLVACRITMILAALFLSACALTPTPTPAPPTPTTRPTIAPTPIPPSPTPVLAPTFAFQKGAKWTYEGRVQWDDKGKAQQKTLTWQTVVVDKIERGDGSVGYVMKGHPLDLAFYTTDKKPSDYLLIAKANRVYQITLISNEPIDRFKNKGNVLDDMLTDETLVLDLPLAAGKKFGPAQIVSNSDGMNVWVVADAKPATLTGIKGITPSNATEYSIDLKTNPDRQTVYYVPNVGITRFTYHHNGTLSEVDVKLIEFSPS
jgi:hypothetical protein